VIFCKGSKLIKAINEFDAHLVQITLEDKLQIKSRDNKKWSPEAIPCQRECVKLQYQKELKKGEERFVPLLS
jgi:hypothetical protein